MGFLAFGYNSHASQIKEYWMEIFAILTFLISIASGLCVTVLPILILVGLGIFL